MKSTKGLLLCAAALILATAPCAFSAEAQSSADKQRKLIEVLRSDAPPGEKAITCKQLAIYGNKDAVPALAPLLEDKDLSSWARIALEAIPGPEADAALRAALPKVQGNQLIGVINSIGVRRDKNAVEPLVEKLRDSNTAIVAAAASALGKIGGTDVATVLGQTLANAPSEVLPAIAEGCILCAEGFLAEDKNKEAASLYDAVRNKRELPEQKRLEGMRGAILAREAAGLPLLLEQLRSPNRGEFGMALRTARELEGGAAITEALAAEMERSEADRQVMLLLAFADRKDSAVLPKLLHAAEKGSRDTRIAAVGLLDRFGDVAAVPILLRAASGDDTALADPAKATLTRMEGKAVDQALLRRFPDASGKTRQVLIELAALRRIEEAVPAVVQSAVDKDTGIRRAAFATLSTLGSDKHVGELVKLLTRTDDEDDREAIESALGSICARGGTKSLPEVLPLVKNNDSDLRIIGLRTLATIGGPDAVAAVAAAVNDPEEMVQDVAVGTLATWPNNWPDDNRVAEPLLSLAKTGRKMAYKVQGVRGYLLHLQENKRLNNTFKHMAIEQLLPILERPEEKRLAITTLSGIPTGKTLDTLTKLAADPALSEEASHAIVNVATSKIIEDATKEQRQKALEIAAEKTRNNATRDKAAAALKAL